LSSGQLRGHSSLVTMPLLQAADNMARLINLLKILLARLASARPAGAGEVPAELSFLVSGGGFVAHELSERGEAAKNRVHSIIVANDPTMSHMESCPEELSSAFWRTACLTADADRKIQAVEKDYEIRLGEIADLKRKIRSASLAKPANQISLSTAQFQLVDARFKGWKKINFADWGEYLAHGLALLDRCTMDLSLGEAKSWRPLPRKQSVVVTRTHWRI